MDDTKKMLQAVINGQGALKEELLKVIEKVDLKVDGLQEEIRGGFKKVNTGLDKLGKSLAYLEDDAPTTDEFDDLEKRIKRIENQISSN
jgi:predicted  nucleic acid-binding Zn-ribbon protein